MALLLCACPEAGLPAGEDAGAASAPSGATAPTGEASEPSKPGEGGDEAVAPSTGKAGEEVPAATGAEAGTETSSGDEPAADGGDPPEPIADVKAPEGYGEFKIPGEMPATEELTGHGLAGYGVVAVYAAPDKESTKLGFLRLGQRLRVGPEIKKDDCRKGWFALETGGYACASKGLVVDPKKPPFMKDTPPPPKKDEPFPYEWAYVKRFNSPMWWRPPTRDEKKRAELDRAKLEAARTGEPVENFLPEWAKPKPEPKPAAPKGAASDGGAHEDPPKEDAADAGLGELPTLDGPPPEKKDPPVEKKDPPPEKEDPPTSDKADDEGGEEAPVEPLPLSPEHPWLEKGYFISLGEKVRDGAQTLWHTARGGYVSTSDAYTYTPKDFSGVELGEEVNFPVGYVMSKTAKVYELKDDDKLKSVKKLERRDFVDLDEETEIRGTAYMITSEGQLIKKSDLVMPDQQQLPKGLDAWERWVDVDLTKQLLVAYEGTKPVYVTLVSTGKKGTEEEPFETPTGRWRIYSKQLTSNMDGATASDGNYAIQDVPWVMYFEGSYALHGAFWHRSFGYTRSHGCVNLGPSDARWLYFWTTPFVPDAWHGAHSSDENPGSTVIVRRSPEAQDE